tara:strand:+ start:1709 stop:1978 length:270 start_codon:yes stop_codon:yes gene_type:complete
MGGKRLSLSIGDVIIDKSNSDVGVLLYKYDILHDKYMVSYPDDDDVVVWAWEIFWAGPHLRGSRYQSYTEFGLENMILAGTVELYRNSE